MDAKQKIILVLTILFFALVAFKIFYLNYTLAMVVPVVGLKVNIAMSVDGHGSEVKVTTTLPGSNERQTIFDETVAAQKFNFNIYNQDGNRFGLWQATSLSGHQDFSYTFYFKGRKIRYTLPDSLPRSLSYPEALGKHLSDTDLVQTGAPIIAEALADFGLDKNSDAIDAVQKIYDFTTHEIKTVGVPGKTDAITTLKLKEASCNGKSRLFVALMRTLGIPSRLVGGLILTSGSKRISHQWVEIYLGNDWVPFDPTNQHFAELPANYLVVYYGDEPFFQRTSNVNFKYVFEIKRQLFPRESDYSSLAAHPLNIMNAWSLFQRAGLSLELLQIILMIPIGAVVTVIFRNIIGLQTFGIFMPALIATSLRESELLWGLLVFLGIIFMGAMLRTVLDRLRILHTPKLTIVLVYVVFALLFVSALGVKFDNMNIANATLFPLALMAITIERFWLIAEENNVWTALKILMNTVLTVIFCYLVIHSLLLQTIVLAFPEIMFLVIVASIYLGSWKGLRLSELIRFRALIFNKERRNIASTS